jgi:diguanylate cyclase (GGDEF)-like protein/PAS domain S-box-containing protein
MNDEAETRQELLEDRADLRQRLAQLQASEARYRRLFEAAQDGILIVNAETGQIDDVNPYMLDLLHYSYEEFIGKKLWEIDPFKDTVLSQGAFKELQDKGYIRYKDLPLQTKSGKQVDVEIIGNGYAVGREKVVQCNVRNISDRKEMEDKLRLLAVTDELTGLYNRRGFITLAEQQLNIAERSKDRLFLLFADVDGMKWINDHLGHLKGDEALIEAADVFKKVFRKADIIARIGGDEFAILAISISAEDTDVLRERLQRQIQMKNKRKNRDYNLSISLGISFKEPGVSISLDELMSQADTLMYEHKKGKNL